MHPTRDVYELGQCFGSLPVAGETELSDSTRGVGSWDASSGLSDRGLVVGEQRMSLKDTPPG